MLTEEQAIEIAKKYGRQHDVSYEMSINERTPEEALHYCGIHVPNIAKMKNFINLSNHPTHKWSEDQLNAINDICNNDSMVIHDIQFPDINPEASEEDIDLLVDTFISTFETIKKERNVFHVMGEMTFTYAFITKAKKVFKKSIFVASTTKREVIENEDGSKTVMFKFVRFRKY